MVGSVVLKEGESNSSSYPSIYIMENLQKTKNTQPQIQQQIAKQRDFTILQSVTYDLLVLGQCQLRPFGTQHLSQISLTTFCH